jgi:CDP-glycerol glycerophosphotransferase (TagB/SpsB family)
MWEYLESVARRGYSISLPDYRDTHDLLCAVDGVVSPMSTILIEAALHGKPVAAYTPTEADASARLTDALPMLHFGDFLALPDVLQPRTLQDLLAVVATLADPAEGVARGARLRAAADHFVMPFEQPWRERLVTFLAQIAGKAHAPQGVAESGLDT